MTNRQQRRQMDKSPQVKEIGNKISEMIAAKKQEKEQKTAEEQAQEQMQQALMQKFMQIGSLIGDLPRPESQEIYDGYIEWIWKSVSNYTVIARYLKKTAEYEISMEIDIADNGILSSANARELGAILISAMNWEGQWRNQAGYFLAGTPEMPVSPPVELKVVSDKPVPKKRAPRKKVADDG